MKLLYIVPVLLVWDPLAPRQSSALGAQSPEAIGRTLELTDVRDLLRADVDVPEFAIGALKANRPVKATATPKPPAASAEATHPPSHRDDPAAIAERAAALQELLELWVRPALDKGQDVVKVTGDGTLIANLTAPQHAWVSRFLALQRDPSSMIDTRFRILSGPRGCFERHLPAAETRFLTQAEAEALLGEVTRDARAEIVSSPSILGFPRRRSYISVLNQFNYVKDWSLEIVEPGHREIAVPELGTVQEGLIVEVRAVMVEATRVGLEISLSQSKLAQPIATAKVPLGRDGQEVEVGLPEVTKVDLTTQLALESGHWALFAAPSIDRDRDVAVLVSVERRAGTPPAPGAETEVVVWPPKGK